MDRCDMGDYDGANFIPRSSHAMRETMRLLFATICLFVAVPPVIAADDTLMDVMYRPQRIGHLDNIESQKILYEERAQSYLESLYNMSYNFEDITALKDIEFVPHKEDVEMPNRPDTAGLKIDTNDTNTPVEASSGSKFLSGGQLDIHTATT
jgi:hypothetical protein